MKTTPVIIVGAGGHGRVLLDALVQTGSEVIGLCDSDAGRHGGTIHGLPVLGGDEIVFQHDPAEVLLVNGVGSIRTLDARSSVYDKFASRGYRFLGVKHPYAMVSPRSTVDPTAQIMAGAIIQIDVKIRHDCIVNTGAVVDHDCLIEAHVHIAPGATLSGAVHVGAESHIGTGATVIQGIRIGKKCMIAAGAVVVDDIVDGGTVAGVPARKIRA